MENQAENRREALKDWLRRYQNLQLYTDRLWDRVDELRGRVEAARTSHLDGMPHGSRVDADRLGGIVAELEETAEEAREAQEEASTARRGLTAAIKQIHGPRWADKREILRLRYIDGLKWEDCAERMFGDDPKYWDRADVFLRRSYKIHGEALEELQDYVPLEAGQENDTSEDDRK